MRKSIITIAVMIICILNAFADIAPNPIKAKGIVTSGKTTIRMVSERVVVDLYKDSSVVECYFFMKNEGVKQKINIGFPEMNFHYWEETRTINFSGRFLVVENDVEVQKMNIYVPHSGSQKHAHAKKSAHNYKEQPWYLWNTTCPSFATRGKLFLVCNGRTVTSINFHLNISQNIFTFKTKRHVFRKLHHP